jgi:hypothetical protein
MVGGNKYKCHICGGSLENVKLPSYDEKKDLILHYELCYIPNSENYIDCKTHRLTIKDEDGFMEENWIIVYGYKVRKTTKKINTKLTGCSRFCEDQVLEVEVDLKDENNTSIFACSKCQGSTEYENCSKKKLKGKVGEGWEIDVYLIGKSRQKPDTKNCERCQKQQFAITFNVGGWKKWEVCQACYEELQHCSKCKKNKATHLIEENKEKKQVCEDCAGDKNKPIDIPKPNPGKDEPDIPDKKEPPKDDKDKPIDKGKEPSKDDKKPNPNELCERCGASCIVHKTKTSYTIKRRRYVKHRTDFTRESSQWFGLNCGCIEKYKQENQQTCSQCKTREFPDMSKGWLLDYEIKKAFCKPECHVAYRELKWEEAQRLTQIEMFPPEPEVETNPGQKIDWEKEGLKKEVLFWRTYAKELERKLNNQNLTPQERLQSSYLRNLQQNTLRNAENAYQSRYGTLTEDGSDNGKGLSAGIIFLIIIGIAVLVGGLIFLLTRNKKSKK